MQTEASLKKMTDFRAACAGIVRGDVLREHAKNLERILAEAVSIRGLARIPRLFMVLVALRLLFIITYPPNLATDAPNYLNMLWHHSSNLIHAGGYSAFMRLVIWIPVIVIGWRLWFLCRGKCTTRREKILVTLLFALALATLKRYRWNMIVHLGLEEESLIYFQYYIILLQHLLVVLALWFAYTTLADALGVLPANASVLVFSLHPTYMPVLSYFSPEWLQGCLLVTSLCSIYWAFRAGDPSRKIMLYTLTSVAFAWCLLVKPNTLVVAFVFPLVFICDRLAWRTKMACVAGAAAAVLVNVGGFLVLFHKPSTGTYAFTHDKAWVLLARLSAFMPDEKLDPEAGIHTKRLIYLNSVLPRGEEWNWCAHAVGHVNNVSVECRKPYREKYLHILTADEATLDRLLVNYKPSKEFGDFYYPFCPTQSFIGLAEGDVLGTWVFIEHVRAHPKAYFGDVLRNTCHSLWESVSYAGTGGPMAPVDLSVCPQQTAHLGFVRLDLKPTSFEQTFMPPYSGYWYSRPYVWKPGAAVYSIWKTVGDVVYQHKPVLFVVLLGVAISAWRTVQSRRLDTRAVLSFILAGMVFVFMMCSNMVLLYRWKEAFPMLFLICPLFVASLMECVWLIQAINAYVLQPREVHISTSSTAYATVSSSATQQVGDRPPRAP